MIKIKAFSITILTLATPYIVSYAQENGGTEETPVVVSDEMADLDVVESTDQPVEIEVPVAEPMDDMEEVVEEAEVLEVIELDESAMMVEEPDAATEVMVEESDTEVMVEESAPEMMVEESDVTPKSESDAGMTVEEIEVEEIVTDTMMTEELEVVTEEPELDIPTLEIDFPESGEMELEFPTDVETEADLAMGDDETISVDFPDEEVRTVIRNVADLYDLNVVIPDTLIGNTSIKLRNVTWRQVFEVVLEPLGYTYVEDQNIIKIRGRDELLQEPVDTRVFLINYAVAAQLQGSLAPLVDAASGGRIQVDTRTNALIITERPSRMNDVQEIIERLDRPNAQVMIESKFIEITDRDQKNIGVNWSSLNAYQLTAGPFDRTFERERDFTGSQTLDRTGIDSDSGTFSDSTTNGVNTITDTTATTDSLDLTDTISDVLTSSTSRMDTAVFSAQAFNVVLSALQSLSDTRLVSNPTVVTLDGEEALISIGERFPVPAYTYNDERGSFEVSGFEYEDIGINLKVRPQVNSAGFIRLDLKPEVSSQAGQVNFGGAAGATVPIIASRRTESNVTLKDGYTLAVGGLIENTVIDGSTKVPLLGDLPYLGKLFSSKTKDETMRNLIIFVTARTLNPDGTTYREIIDPRVLQRMGIVDSDVPGYEIPDDERKAMNEIDRMRNQAAAMEARLKYEREIKSIREAQEAKEKAEQERLQKELEAEQEGATFTSRAH